MLLWLIMLDRMTQKDLTLQDLAARSDVEARTIRSWIQQGLVPGPRALGRKARYGPDSLTHLLAVKAMRDLYGMPLQAIRQELLVADRAKLETYARQLSAGVGEDETGIAGPGTGAADAVPEAPPATTAAEYLRALRASGRFGRAGIELSRRAAGAPSETGGPVSRSLSQEPALPPLLDLAEGAQRAPRQERVPARSRLAVLLERLEGLLGERSVARKAQGDVWLHIPVTPDVQLAVRGDLTPEEIARFERIADVLRELLSGGSFDD
jgi:DNA-binding transcriptional MerR regulator